MYISNKKGFTIVELLIVISIIIILLAVVLPQFGRTRDVQILNSTVADINSVIHKAKSLSMASYYSKRYGIYILSCCYILVILDKDPLVQDELGIPGTVKLERYEIPNRVQIDSNFHYDEPPYPMPETLLYFDRLTGVPNATGTIRVNVGDFIKTITIDKMGQISNN